MRETQYLEEMDESNVAMPHITTGDALVDGSWSECNNVDLIISNPPWGAKFGKSEKELSERFVW